MNFLLGFATFMFGLALIVAGVVAGVYPALFVGAILVSVGLWVADR